ncbi:hypothetical protein PI124_g6151 [Phytophthora idaei]|nr:hypothetical protein PI125_g5805 [Phytophthora idaei]KAG3167244.1 hypothetical protein PI126_g3871 [Phytophthora idaei]KAG3249150.1 hypothetical protein PI124_g6151 [Phytophthora idaei]
MSAMMMACRQAKVPGDDVEPRGAADGAQAREGGVVRGSGGVEEHAAGTGTVVGGCSLLTASDDGFGNNGGQSCDAEVQINASDARLGVAIELLLAPYLPLSASALHAGVDVPVHSIDDDASPWGRRIWSR